jgi:hypothetical protein
VAALSSRPDRLPRWRIKTGMELLYIDINCLGHWSLLRLLV